MTALTAPPAVPEGFFIGRQGKLVPLGENQYAAYGVRRGKRGTRVVPTHTAMVEDTAGVSKAVGKGFDSAGKAQEWCDKFVLESHPRRIAELRAEVDVLVRELASAQSRL